VRQLSAELAQARSLIASAAEEPELDGLTLRGRHVEPSRYGASLGRCSRTPGMWPSPSVDQPQTRRLRRHDGLIEIRDSKDHGAGPTLRFRSDELAAFLDGAKAGEFDHLL
jgi:hypothetical protein